MFWKLLPLLIEIVRGAGNVLVERYRARKASGNGCKQEAEKQPKVVVDSNKQQQPAPQEK